MDKAIKHLKNEIEKDLEEMRECIKELQKIENEIKKED